MNELARRRLGALIASYSSSLCSTPHVCTVLLRQHCPECPTETDVLVKAVHQGTVQQLLALPHRNDYPFVCGGLVGELMHEAHLLCLGALLGAWAAAFSAGVKNAMR